MPLSSIRPLFTDATFEQSYKLKPITDKIPSGGREMCMNAYDDAEVTARFWNAFQALPTQPSVEQARALFLRMKKTHRLDGHLALVGTSFVDNSPNPGWLKTDGVAMKTFFEDGILVFPNDPIRRQHYIERILTDARHYALFRREQWALHPDSRALADVTMKRIIEFAMVIILLNAYDEYAVGVWLLRYISQEPSHVPYFDSTPSGAMTREAILIAVSHIGPGAFLPQLIDLMIHEKAFTYEHYMVTSPSRVMSLAEAVATLEGYYGQSLPVPTEEENGKYPEVVIRPHRYIRFTPQFVMDRFVMVEARILGGFSVAMLSVAYCTNGGQHVFVKHFVPLVGAYLGYDRPLFPLKYVNHPMRMRSPYLYNRPVGAPAAVAPAPASASAAELVQEQEQQPPKRQRTA